MTQVGNAASLYRGMEGPKSVWKGVWEVIDDGEGDGGVDIFGGAEEGLMRG